MRILKLTAGMAAALALTATSVFAGPSCGASKQVKTVSAKSSCLSTVFAGANKSCVKSKAALAELVEIESTRLPSGALVVMYKGKTDDAIAYLQASTDGEVASFCCPLTRDVASNDECTVEVAKTSTGAIIVVTSEKSELVDKYEQSLLQLAAN